MGRLSLLTLLCICAHVSGQAIRYDGAANQSTTYAQQNVGTNAFTVCMWVQRGSVAGNITYMSSRDAVNGWALDGGPAPYNRVRMIIDNGPSAVNTTSTNTVDDGLWHHIAGVRDSSGLITIYIDGVDQSGSKSSLTGDVSSAAYTVVGVNTVSYNEWFTGTTADSRVYCRALSSDEMLLIGSKESSMLLTPDVASCLRGSMTTADTYTTLSGNAINTVGPNGVHSNNPTSEPTVLQFFKPHRATFTTNGI